MTKIVFPVAGVLLVLIGAVWTLQGANVITGSGMSGSRLWLIVGVVCVIVGIGLVGRAISARRASRP